MLYLVLFVICGYFEWDWSKIKKKEQLQYHYTWIDIVLSSMWSHCVLCIDMRRSNTKITTADNNVEAASSIRLLTIRPVDALWCEGDWASSLTSTTLCLPPSWWYHITLPGLCIIVLLLHMWQSNKAESLLQFLVSAQMMDSALQSLMPHSFLLA